MKDAVLRESQDATRRAPTTTKPKPEKSLLLVTQRNEALEALQRAGLDPGQFQWREWTLDRIPTVVDEGVVSVLVHVQTEYYFCFDTRREHRVEFSPGESLPREHHYPGPWGGAIAQFQRWAQFLKRELDSPDLWGELSKGTSLIVTATSSNLNDNPLTDEERSALVGKLREIETYLFSVQDVSSEFKEFVERRFDYLEGAVGRLGKSDWIHTLIGVVATIAFSGMLSTANARDLFRFVSQMIAGFFQQMLP